MHYRAFLTNIYLQISKLNFLFSFFLCISFKWNLLLLWWGAQNLEEKCVGDFQSLILFQSNSIICNFWKSLVANILVTFTDACDKLCFYFWLVIGRSIYLMLYYFIFLKDTFVPHNIIKLYMFCLKLPKYGIFICFLKQIFYNV